MSQPPTVVHAPDVTTQADDLLCPMCEYDLRGQVEPRCPECGYRFDFEELRDSARRLHPYLFEHHPQRNVRSFVQTVIGHLRPRRFWTLLHPAQPSRPGRLVIYLLIVCFTTLLPLATQMGMMMYTVQQQREDARAQFTRWMQRQYPNLNAAQLATNVNQYYPSFTLLQLLGVILTPWQIMQLANLFIVPPAWLLLTMAALQVFQFSMRRARIRSIHMTRCVVYSGDVIVWMNLALLAVTVASFMKWMAGPLLDYAFPLFALSWLVFVWRLRRALHHYARFKQAIATILASQIVVALAISVILVWISMLSTPYR